MPDLAIAKEQKRSPKRRYRMRRRAEQVDETRQRITEAAVRLHTSVGPANTTISSVADEAGVTRLTVYRHFEDLDALFVACMGHWSTLNPGPDIQAWRSIDHLEARATRAFGELYAWYAARDDELYPIYRDRAAMPTSAQAAMMGQVEAIADAVVTADGSMQAAVARHLVDFWTWRSLVVDRGLGVTAAAEAAVTMLTAVDR